MASVFSELKEIISSIESVNDPDNLIIDVVSKMSEINELFIEISIKKGKHLKELQNINEKIRHKYNEYEEKLHLCQTLADENVSNEFNIDPNKLKLRPVEDFIREKGLTEEIMQHLTKEEFLIERMKYEVNQIEMKKNEYNKIAEQKVALQEQLKVAQNKFGVFLVKMQKMYQEVMSFKQKLDEDSAYPQN
ncbi:hypothetical protein GPJ56_004107 [Histomonas meleagridis]|uniref:uncharacterized protein n=1 Tax=Histomonas meleagridis TaxID=135588 RepID=UPI003559D25C|nr:hypothetical protein GPJ56_004107 [Histomonas meleagridis]KAH0801448.1 hypothetical protein GO595_005700 [Histomonas meleagridis]